MKTRLATLTAILATATLALTACAGGSAKQRLPSFCLTVSPRRCFTGRASQCLNA